MSKIEEAIIDYWGERCSDFNAECATCQAWALFDGLPARQWQDISTAPKDGTWFLAYGAFLGGDCCEILRFGGENGTPGQYGPFIWGTPGSLVSCWAEQVPTHWMPLPPAPEDKP